MLDVQVNLVKVIVGTISYLYIGECWRRITHGLYLQKKCWLEVVLVETLRQLSQSTSNKRKKVKQSRERYCVGVRVLYVRKILHTLRALKEPPFMGE